MASTMKKRSASKGPAGWRELFADVKRWAKDVGWPLTTERKIVDEDDGGPFAITILHITTPKGRVDLEPVNAPGRDSRVDLTAWPSLNRVRLMPVSGTWLIYTDSNIRWPKQWNRETFVELACELAASE